MILDDGALNTKTLSLGSRKATFEDIETGKSVKVQLAIVVDHADGDYLISDILEQSINQSLSKPAFMTDIKRVEVLGVPENPDTEVKEFVKEELGTIKDAAFYYVGYNETFGNYKADTYTFKTRPSTARLRIGLAHSSSEDKDARDDVDFNAYIVRVTDEDGDTVPEGDDVATVESKYGTRLVVGISSTATASIVAFSNVRINDGGTIQPSVQNGGTAPSTPADLNSASAPGASGLSYGEPKSGTELGSVFAMAPDEHRDFPIDILSSDETYKFTAWAVNDDDEVISPVASLSVRPIDEKVIITGPLMNYASSGDGNSNDDPGDGKNNTIYVTEFTVLK